jgi:hypothetical protein
LQKRINYINRISLRNRNEYFHLKYKLYKNKLKHLLNISKKSDYNNYFHINNGNMKNIWKGIKELVTLKQSSITSPSTIEVDNTKITNSKQIANAFKLLDLILLILYPQ